MRRARYLLVAAIVLTAGSPASAEVLKDVSIQVQGLANCRAGSRRDPEALGGFAVSKNDSKPIGDLALGIEGQLALVALPQDTVPFFEHYRGMRLLLINRSQEEAVFSASDSRLAIVQEARDAQVEWLPIEQVYYSWCGNSGHRVFLPAGRYWEFVVPAYTGPLQATLRFHFASAGLVSNEFEGSIHPQQLKSDPGGMPQPWSALLEESSSVAPSSR